MVIKLYDVMFPYWYENITKHSYFLVAFCRTMFRSTEMHVTRKEVQGAYGDVVLFRTIYGRLLSLTVKKRMVSAVP